MKEPCDENDFTYKNTDLSMPMFHFIKNNSYLRIIENPKIILYAKR